MSIFKTDATEGLSQGVTAQRMRAIEAAAFQSGKISSAEAMDRAGRAVSSCIRERCPRPGHALVLCGPGNNGGDGYVVALDLAEAGWGVTVAGLAEADAMPTDAAAARRRWEANGAVENLALAFPQTPPPTLIVDAVFGIGLSRPISAPLSDRFLETQRIARAAGALCVAVDLPSGLHTDTGEVLGTALPADVTVTFHAIKAAHIRALELCGEVVLVDIGL